MGDLVERRDQAVAVTPQAANLLAQVVEASRDKDVDAAKIEIMANLAMRLQDREMEAQFNRDLNAAKKEMPSIQRDGSIRNNAGKVQSRFSSWEKLNPIVTDILSRHSLTIGHEIGSTSDGKIAITPILTHDNGMERRGKEMVFPPDTSGNKSAAQAVVSSSSYGQRVTTIKLLNIRTHDAPDNDGASTPADPYDVLTADERALVDEGRQRAADGLAAYGDWFKSLSTDRRGFLAYNKAANGRSWHSSCKELAEKIDAN